LGEKKKKKLGTLEKGGFLSKELSREEKGEGGDLKKTIQFKERKKENRRGGKGGIICAELEKKDRFPGWVSGEKCPKGPAFTTRCGWEKIKGLQGPHSRRGRRQGGEGLCKALLKVRVTLKKKGRTGGGRGGGLDKRGLAKREVQKKGRSHERSNEEQPYKQRRLKKKGKCWRKVLKGAEDYPEEEVY